MYSGVLAGYGFLPIEAFRDLRTDGFGVVPVDFGEDLGEPFCGNDDDAHLLVRVTEFLASYNVAPMRQRMEEWFLEGHHAAKNQMSRQ